MAWHVFACSVIALMLGYIVYEKNADKHALLCQTLRQNLDKSSMVMASNNAMLTMQINAVLDCYVNPITVTYAQRSDTLQFLKDSLIQFLDLAKTSGKPQELSLIIEKYNLFISNTKRLIDHDKRSVEAIGKLAFNDSLGLKCSALWFQSPEDQRLAISLIQNNIHKVLTIDLNYIASQVAMGDIRFDAFQPFVSVANVNFSAPDENYVEGDIALSWSSGCGAEIINNYKLFLDGKEYPVNPYGGTKFRKIYEQAGIYPLIVRAELYEGAADSLFVSEKTYYIRVR